MSKAARIPLVAAVLLSLCPSAAPGEGVAPRDCAKKMRIVFEGYDPPGLPDETLTNFPALVVLCDDIGGSGFGYDHFASTNGHDLRFTDESGRDLIPHEVDGGWVDGGTNFVWVRVPVLSDTNSAIWAYWGSASATQPDYTTNGAVWVGGYVGVWHLGEEVADGGTVAGVHRDSTANALHMDQEGNDDASGIVGKAQAFESTERVTRADTTDSPLDVTNAITVTAWIFPHGDVTKYDCYVDKSETGSWALEAGSSLNSVNFNTNPNGQSPTYFPGTGSVLAGNEWQQIGGRYNRLEQTNGALFVNGAIAMTVDHTGRSLGPDNENLSFAFGPYPDKYSFIGAMDEVRIASVARSEAWVWAEYLTMASNTVFNSYGNVQSAASGTIVTIR